MNLSKADITREIKNLTKAKNIFKEQAFLDYIGLKCLEVLRESTDYKASEFLVGEAPETYKRGHTFDTQILNDRSIIKLSNIATNQFGEYISAYIEYGTGVYSENSTRPEGWYYPTTERDMNTTKRKLENGDYIAFTYGQKGKEIYDLSIRVIEQKIDGWIDDYIRGDR